MIVKNVEKKDKNIVSFVVEADADEFEIAVKAAYQKNKKNISIPGFRKGKAPRMVIEGMYGADVFYDDAFTDLSPEAFAFAVEEENINAVGMPTVTNYEVSDEKTLSILFETAVYPEVTLGQYKGIEAPKGEAVVSDADVDAEIERVRNRNSRLVVVEREAKEGDSVVIDFEGFLDGVPFEGGKAEDHLLQLGSGQFVPGFEEQVVGMKAGEEKDIDITFPENYHEELAGKAVVFKVKCKEVKETELPELDDEFAKDVSEFDTLDEYKNSIREQIFSSRETQVQNEFENEVIKKCIENMDCDIPEQMVEERQKQLVADYSNNLRAQGYSLDQYLQMIGIDRTSFQNSTRPTAFGQLQNEIMLTAVADAEGCEASDEELEEEYKSYADAYNVEVQTVKTAFDPDILKGDIRRRKAAKIIIDSAIPTAKVEPAEEEAEAAPAEEAQEKAEEKPKKARKTTTKSTKAAKTTEEAATKSTTKKAEAPEQESAEESKTE